MAIRDGDETTSTEVVSGGGLSKQKTSHPTKNELPRSVLSVLVIDDDPAFCKLAARCLDDFAEVRFRFGVPEPGVLDLAGYDIVLLDYRLPARDGIEILEEIREISPSIPVLFLTGYGDPELAERALRMGATAFLPKPIELRKLREAIEEACDPRESRNNRVAGVSSADASLPDYPDNVQEFTATSGSGGEIVGSVLRFGCRSVFVNFPQDYRLSQGEEVRRVKFQFGDQVLECGSGWIGGISRFSSEAFEMEVFLSGVWRVTLSEKQGAINLSEIRDSRSNSSDSLLEDWSELSPDFRLAVNELAESLGALQSICAEMSTGTDSVSIERFSVENRMTSEVAEQYGELFWRAIRRFEAACDEIEENGSAQTAKSYARRVLYPFILASPFLARIVERPIGVPGDFGILGQILGNPLDGYDLYGRILNFWILSCGAASAYRYRVGLLHREIVETVRRVNVDEARPAKILSMASGVAYELQRFIENPPEFHNVDFTLVDFSEVTLKEARRQFSLFGEIPEKISLNLHQSSVIDLANRSRGVEIGGAMDEFQPDLDYDLIYCAGLFDYLSDRLIIRVTQYLFSLLGDNGKLVVSNFTTENPLRAWMTFVVDWELVYRSVEQFEELMVRAMGEDIELQKETDEEGVEVYVLIKK